MTSLHPLREIRPLLRGQAKVDAVSIRNKELDIEFRKDQVAIRDRIRVAVLGGSGVGKSTFLRQVKLLFGSGYDDTEREELGASIQANLVESMRLTHLKESTTISDDPELEKSFSFFIEATPPKYRHVAFTWRDHMANGCRELWTQLRAGWYPAGMLSEAEISLAAMVPILPDVYGRYGSQVAADGS
ncbi:hypothetical protein B0H13DRAFT_1928886 [Mycena leptocephala]|nr:hypothetical protein B0H13DRAFT_1928886 [Mycena leptocephala]